jgi:hypothetical protein
MRRWASVFGLGCLVAVCLPDAAAAQPPRQPIPPVVLDVRGAIGLLGQSNASAADLGRVAADLPSKGLGLVTGIHVYPIRRPAWGLGIGGELIWTRARQAVVLIEDEMEIAGPTIARRLDGMSAQLSLNFGHRDGWSYLSGGLGPLAFDTWDDASTPDGVRATTLNYGGGARWFTRPHLAVGFDVRFYATRPATSGVVVAARDRQTVMVVSVGISVR